RHSLAQYLFALFDSILFAFFCVSLWTSVGQNQGIDAVRKLFIERQNNVATHRQAADDRSGNVESIHQGSNVLRHTRHCCRFSSVTFAEPSKIWRNYPEVVFEGRNLTVPECSIERITVQKNHWPTRTGVVKRQIDAVDVYLSHLFPSVASSQYHLAVA